MKKTLLILPVMVGAIFLGGCGAKNEKSPDGNVTLPEKTIDATKENQTGGIVGSLRDMVGMGKKMVCTTNIDGVETKTFIEGKKYKSIITTKEGVMNSIFDGETFYSWDEKKRMPIKMTMACMEEIGKDMPKNANTDGPGFDSTDELLEEKPNQDCKEATEAIDFTIPTDVSFVDQCLMMQNITNGMKGGGLPKDIDLSKDTNLPVQE